MAAAEVLGASWLLFNSWQFLVGFLPAALIVYWAADRYIPAYRLLVLLLLSFGFYSYWDIRFLPLLLLSILINWIVAQAFCRGRRSAVIVLAIVANLALLGVFKYTGFITDLLAPYLTLPTSAIRDLALPLGISFFTFHHVMYLTDLRAGKAPQFGLVNYGLYIAFFPQVLSGPLVRWSEIMHQLDERPYARQDVLDRMTQGVVLLILGLAKKVLISDPLAKVSDPLFHIASRVVELGLFDAWQAALAFTLQIYFDFSGYTDMALGIALMFGIVLPQNFNAPYRATSLQDFWRRWHMTLSRFLRDYLYIPLGGNRRGLLIQLAALFITMALGGLWHGAGVNFLLWGCLHGAALCIVVLWTRTGLFIPAAVGWLLTFTFVVVAWIPFRASDFISVVMLWKGMFGMHDQVWHRFSLPSYWLPIALAFLVAVVGPVSWSLAERARVSRMVGFAAGTLLAVALLRLGTGDSQQFIYFQF